MRTILTALMLSLLALAGCLDESDSPGDGGVDGGDSDNFDGEGPSGNGTGYQGFDGEPDDCLRVAPAGPFSTDAVGAATGYETRVLDIILAVDASFVSLHGDNWTGVVDFIAEMADDVYQRELQLEVKVVDVVQIPLADLEVVENTAAEVDGEASQKIIDDTKAYFEAHYADVDRDLVYTLVGTSAAGAIAGQADCIGGAKFKDVSYGWGEALDIDPNIFEFGPVAAWQYNSVKVILHEMAHILGAHHHYQVCGPYAAQSAPQDSFGACSIMTNAVDFASFYFSPVNKAAIRGYADSVDL